MPDWRGVQLGEVANLIDGQYLAKENYRTGKIEVHGAGALMGYHDEASTPGPVSVVGRIGTIGKVRHMPSGCWINNNALGVKTTSEELDARFLSYWLEGLDWSRVSAGTAQPYIKKGALKKQEVRLPPISVQLAIVDLLEDFDALIQSANREAESIDDFLSSIGQEVWRRDDVPRVKLAALGTVVTGSTPKTSVPAYWSSDDVPFLTPGDIGRFSQVNKSARFVSEEGARASRSIPAGSVAVVCIGATIGKVGLTTRASVTNQQINSVTGMSASDAALLACLLSAPEGKEHLLSGSGQTAVPILKKSSFAASELPWPTEVERERLGLLVQDALDARDAIQGEVDRLVQARALTLGEILREEISLQGNGTLEGVGS